jgi:hypothetical protein
MPAASTLYSKLDLRHKENSFGRIKELEGKEVEPQP